MKEQRKNILKGIDRYIISDRLNQIDEDYLEFEIKMSSILDLQRLYDCLVDNNNRTQNYFKTNPS